MNFNEIQKLSSPFDNENAANKYHIDNSIKNSLDTVNNSYLKLDGSQTCQEI